MNKRNIEKSAVLLTAMANPKRLEILLLLAEAEMSVSVLSVTVGLSQSALSQHLGKLRLAKLVKTRRDAQTIFYSCQSREVRTMLEALATIFGDTSPKHLQLTPA